MNHSLVSFCALQLELEDKPVNNIPNIDFNSNRTIEDLFRDLEISNPVARIRHNKQDPVAHRGTRQMSEIIIETYSNFKGGMSEGHKGEKEKSSSNSSKVRKYYCMALSIYVENISLSHCVQIASLLKLLNIFIRRRHHRF